MQGLPRPELQLPFSWDGAVSCTLEAAVRVDGNVVLKDSLLHRITSRSCTQTKTIPYQPHPPLHLHGGDHTKKDVC